MRSPPFLAVAPQVPHSSSLRFSVAPAPSKSSTLEMILDRGVAWGRKRDSPQNGRLGNIFLQAIEAFPPPSQMTPGRFGEGAKGRPSLDTIFEVAVELDAGSILQFDSPSAMGCHSRLRMDGASVCPPSRFSKSPPPPRIIPPPPQIVGPPVY